MSKSINRVFLLGNLAKDANCTFTPSGIAKTVFTVVTNRRWKDKASDEWKEEADFHNCVQWRAEKLAQYLTKGTKVHVTGELRTRKYEKDGTDRWITEVVVDDVVLCGGGGKRDSNGGGESQEQSSMDDFDVPF